MCSQYFWFRHAFLLGPSGADAIQGAALALLRDKKLEVQDMAAALLAGLLKGLSPSAAAELRQQCIADVEAAFPAKGRRRKSAAPSGGWLRGHLVHLGARVCVCVCSTVLHVHATICFYTMHPR